MERVLAQVNIREFAPNPNLTTFGDAVSVVVRNAFMLAGLITFVLLVFGGLGVIMGAGSGDTKKLESGKKTVTGAVIGLNIVVTSFWLVQLLERITGMTLLGTQ